MELKKKALAFFLFALSVRLLYLFFVVPVDWIGDSYHHWQIAWYTLNIGSSHGRMWDLMGCEYYWPLLPSLFEAFLMWMFHSSSMIFMRVANIFFSSFSIVLCYLIGRSYREEIGASFAAAAMFFPFIINYDVLALHEPMMIFFALFGILLYLKTKDFYAGLLIGLACLCHFSVYPLVLILCLLYIIHFRSATRLLPFVTGFALIYAPYAYALLLHTGDALYNIHCLITFTFTSGGGLASMISPFSPIIGPILITIAMATLFITVHKRCAHESKLFSLAMILLGYTLFWGGIITFIGAPFDIYVRRYFILPFILSLFFLSVGLNRIRFLRLKLKMGRISISASPVVLTVFSITLLIISIPYYTSMQNSIRYSFKVADYIGTCYKGGTIISPTPSITYRLTDRWHIPPQNILGPMYCPPSYPEKSSWLKKENVTLLLWIPVYEMDRVFPELKDGENHPPLFLIYIFDSYMLLYEVRWQT